MSNSNPIQIVGGKRSRVFVDASYGEHKGVIVGYALLDQVEETFGDQTSINDKIQIIYEIEERITEEEVIAAAKEQGVEVNENVLAQVGHRKTVRGKRMNRKLSLADSKYPSGLNKFLNLILAKTLTNDDIRAFHPDKLYGTPVALNITPSASLSKSGKPFQEVAANAWSKFAGQGLIPDTDLIVVKPREKAEAAAQ
jgi:hypothetical protein